MKTQTIQHPVLSALAVPAATLIASTPESAITYRVRQKIDGLIRPHQELLEKLIHSPKDLTDIELDKLARIPMRTRALGLYVLSQLTFAEIAERLSINRDTASGLIGRNLTVLCRTAGSAAGTDIISRGIRDTDSAFSCVSFVNEVRTWAKNPFGRSIRPKDVEATAEVLCSFLPWLQGRREQLESFVSAKVKEGVVSVSKRSALLFARLGLATNGAIVISVSVLKWEEQQKMQSSLENKGLIARFLIGAAYRDTRTPSSDLFEFKGVKFLKSRDSAFARIAKLYPGFPGAKHREEMLPVIGAGVPDLLGLESPRKLYLIGKDKKKPDCATVQIVPDLPRPNLLTDAAKSGPARHMLSIPSAVFARGIDKYWTHVSLALNQQTTSHVAKEGHFVGARFDLYCTDENATERVRIGTVLFHSMESPKLPNFIFERAAGAVTDKERSQWTKLAWYWATTKKYPAPLGKISASFKGGRFHLLAQNIYLPGFPSESVTLLPIEVQAEKGSVRLIACYTVNGTFHAFLRCGERDELKKIWCVKLNESLGKAGRILDWPTARIKAASVFESTN